MPVLHLIEPTFDFGEVNSSSKLLVSGSQHFDQENHTSLGDMTAEEILEVAKHYDSINFVSNKFDQQSDIYKESIILLNVLKHSKNVSGYTFTETNKFLSVDVESRPNEPVLWLFGCSHAHGVGLETADKTFGQLVAETLNLPLINITRPGTSLTWSFRHLINAPIKPNDFVIWQITTPDRVSLFDGINTKEVLLNQTSNRCLVEINNDFQVFFNHTMLLNSGINYLRSINSQFVFVDLSSPTIRLYDYLIEYAKYPEYCSYTNRFIDVGTDGIHAGPLSHKHIAQRILNHVYCIND